MAGDGHEGVCRSTARAQALYQAPSDSSIRVLPVVVAIVIPSPRWLVSNGVVASSTVIYAVGLGT